VPQLPYNYQAIPGRCDVLGKLLRRLKGTASPGGNTLTGAVDGLVHGAWQGWVLDLDQPGRTLAVTLVMASGRRMDIPADRYRADVHRVMPGHGYYGFRIPARLLGAERPVEVLVEGAVLAFGSSTQGG
jgi:hypothetical protein